jgi:hypothetical protein
VLAHLQDLQSGVHAESDPLHTTGDHRGDADAEARLTGIWMAHLLISSKELLHNLWIDTARKPRRIEPPRQSNRDLSGNS